jgi:hypothetical protein
MSLKIEQWVMLRLFSQDQGSISWLDGNAILFEPLFGGFGIGADEEDFLDGAGGGVLAFDAGGGGVLDFEAGGCFAAADFDAAGDDAGDVGAVFDDAVEDLVEAVDPAVLAFDAAELHGEMLHDVTLCYTFLIIC